MHYGIIPKNRRPLFPNKGGDGMDNTINEDEFKKYDGQDGRAAYVSYQGNVYDVSSSKKWAGGIHMRRHQAGHDLTAEFAAAPHDESVLKRVHKIGRLRLDEKEKQHPLLSRYLDLHPHPITVHFPIALLFIAAIFLIIYLPTGILGLEQAAFYTFLAGVIMSPVTILTGISCWWFNYAHQRSTVFIRKAGLASILFVLGVTAISLWVTNREALVTREVIGWIYFSIVLVISGLVLALGKLGGEIIFPGKKRI